MTKTTKFGLLSICISAVIHFRWFTSFAILSDGDWLMRFRDEMLHMLTWPEAWQPVGLGNFYLTVPFYFMEVTNAALHRLGLTFGVIERVEYLWPIVVLTPLGAFLLARKLTRSDFAAFIASLAWSCNVYFFVKQQSHIYIMLANSLMPFAALAYHNALRSRKPRDLVIAGLALFAVTATDFRLFYVLAFILAGWALSELVAEKAWRSKKLLFKHAVVAAAPLVMALALNAYWIIGFVTTGSLANNSILDRGLFGGYLVSTADALTVFRGDWTDGVPLVFGTAPVPWRMWWLPLTALAGLWVRRRDKDAVFFAVVALAGIFLSKQSDFPLPHVYDWLFAHVPGFKAFRESSKFFVVTALGYTALVGYFAAWLETEAQGALHTWRKPLFAALVLLPLWNSIPLLTGDIHAIFVPVSLRREYAAMNDFMSSQPEFSRVIAVPRGSPWMAATPLHPRATTDDIQNSRVAAKGADEGSGWESEMFKWPQTQGELDLRSVRYVAVPLANAENHDDSFALLQEDRKKVIADLDASPFLKRKDIGSGDLAFYENPSARPYAWTTNLPDSVAEPAPFIPVEHREVDTSRHELVIRGATGPFFLHVSSAFHPGWSLFERLPSRWEQLSFAHRTVEGVTHEKDVVGTNLYRIDPETACRTLPCTPNPDGSQTIRAALFFTPQAYFDLGSVITASGLLGCLLALLLTMRRGKSKIV